MIEPLKQHEFEKLCDLLESVCGIVLKQDQEYLIETRLTELANNIGVSNFGEFHRRVVADDTLLAKTIDLMTTNETLWFRDSSCWLTLEEIILPSLIQKIQQGQQSIRIWSAACSTGQEPYSLAILLDELLKKQGLSHLIDRFNILGTDISQAANYLAKRACYDPFTINRGMSKERLSEYFEPRNNAWQLSDKIRDRIDFQVFNLMDSFHILGKFDLVLCRNVAIYFSDTFKKELFHKISTVLLPKGYMLLGATESLFGMNADFENLSHGNGLYYRVK